MKSGNRWAGFFLTLAMVTAVVPASGASAEQPSKDRAGNSYVEGQILVKVKPGKDAAVLSKKLGASEAKSLGGAEWKLVKVPMGKTEEYLAKFKGDSDVAAAELDYIYTALATTPNDPLYSSQWHLPNIGADVMWDTNRGSASNVIAIIDTGVDLTHPDLVGKIVPGYNFVAMNTNANDDQGHGTFMATLAAANTNNAVLGAGVDWYAKIMPVKVLDATGGGTTSTIISGVQWAADNGAKVINMSIGGGSYSTAFQNVIDYAWSKGVVLTAAAGSSGSTLAQYPAAYNNVVAVAATTSSDLKASFSSYGSWVDFAAPGSSIVSSKMGGGWTTMSGSSTSSAIVAGAVTLAWSKYPTYTNAGIISYLGSRATPIAGTGTYWNYGKINLR
ncbi:S8 family serine peptidase [Tumebacillus algifaecis]|uniref:S8 family serine peptidase n=1 Tax=Tumebacillus algifaecis TaxID=1214604 RepID=UPI0012FDDEFD|nr:S8 family serine peptidase [Tumebacillus algifaecis]